MDLDATPARRTSIEVYGLSGMFAVPSTNVAVRFFSTLANNRQPGEGATDLLRELMPMRERVPPGALPNLNALLQRDLNDARVAHELVPYLKGQTGAGVAFFPAILAALMPKGFIQGDGGVYPQPEEIHQDSRQGVRYGTCWEIEQFSVAGQPLPLGKLTLHPASTDIVVLDGQHRANAFRFVSGVFGRDEGFYSAFYQTQTPLDHFDADLPVTLIWFESIAGAEVQPTFISRNLFVDVNTNARKVNRSRNILLDDRHVSSLIARFFLSATAEVASFETSQFSLLHSGFDLDTDLTEGSGHALTLTNPDILEYVASWLLFGSRDYSRLHQYRVSREMARLNTGPFAAIFDGPDFNRSHVTEQGNEIVLVMPEQGEGETESERLQRFERAYRTSLHPVFDAIFNGFEPYRRHYKACEAVALWCTEEVGSADIREVWQRVFCGGEGLYYSLDYYARSQVRPGARARSFSQAVREVEQRFATERATQLLNPGEDVAEWERRVSQAYDSMRTKAFQVGLFMALDVWKGNEPLADATEEFVGHLNRVAPEQWVYLLTELRREVEPAIDPKKWPAYQKLILRAIQDDERVYYHEGNFADTPDAKPFDERLHRRFDNWKDPDDLPTSTTDVPPDLVRRWGAETKQEIDQLLERAGITPLDVDSHILARERVERYVRELNADT